MTMTIDRAKIEAVRDRLRVAAGYSCELECYGRCKVCPAEAEREAAALLDEWLRA